MSNQIIPFEFKGAEVRVITIDNEPWFVLADLCAVLDIANPRNVAARIDVEMKGVHPVDTPGGKQNMLLVSEAGMYEVVIRSDKPEAAAFRRWITGTVLPEIRKTGSYGAPAALPQGPELLAHAVLAANQMIAEKDATIAELAPKADYVDTFVADDDLRLLRNIAKSLGMTEKELRADLVGRSWIYEERSSRWSEKQQEKVGTVRYSAYSHKSAYFTPVPVHDAPRFKGEVMHTLKVTPQGAIAIARLYGKHLQAVAS